LFELTRTWNPRFRTIEFLVRWAKAGWESCSWPKTSLCSARSRSSSCGRNRSPERTPGNVSFSRPGLLRHWITPTSVRSMKWVKRTGRVSSPCNTLKAKRWADRAQRHKLDLGEALSIARQMADALADAHAHRILHRDIKPQNVMITPRGQVKVLDFGLAKMMRENMIADGEAATAASMTTPGKIIGTVPYMSPEQVRGEELDARSDIFSFGAVLYELVSGHHPFAERTPAEQPPQS
jgi:serine/threonine protein kinase